MCTSIREYTQVGSPNPMYIYKLSCESLLYHTLFVLFTTKLSGFDVYFKNSPRSLLIPLHLYLLFCIFIWWRSDRDQRAATRRIHHSSSSSYCVGAVAVLYFKHPFRSSPAAVQWSAISCTVVCLLSVIYYYCWILLGTFVKKLSWADTKR